TKITDVLSREHQVALQKLSLFEKALQAFDCQAIEETIHFFDEKLILHRRKEEEVLFPALGRYIGTKEGPIACMLEEHRDEKEKIDVIRNALQENSGLLAKKRIQEAGRYILELLRNHIAKEDNILFPLAEQTLTEEDKKEIQKKMKAIGFCCPECAQ
ncbi:MAG: hemerythrin domain-containing protein, partial [Elusimicrobiota bacterium]